MSTIADKSVSTIADKLQDLIEAKADMKAALIEKGVTPTGGLSTYADAIMKISTSSQPLYLPLGTKFAYTTFETYRDDNASSGYSCTVQDAINLLNPEETDMSYMFYRSSIPTYYGESLITNFDTSKVTDMSYMFRLCRLSKIPNIDTSKVRYMRHMFDNVNRYEYTNAGVYEVEIPDLDCSSVIDITGLFSDDGWYVPKINNMCKFINLGKQPDLIGTDSQGFLWWRILSREEYLRIVNALYNRAEAGYNVKKILLSSGTINNLSDADIALATNKGWSLIS